MSSKSKVEDFITEDKRAYLQAYHQHGFAKNKSIITSQAKGPCALGAQCCADVDESLRRQICMECSDVEEANLASFHLGDCCDTHRKQCPLKIFLQNPYHPDVQKRLKRIRQAPVGQQSLEEAEAKVVENELKIARLKLENKELQRVIKFKKKDKVNELLNKQKKQPKGKKVFLTNKGQIIIV